MRKCSASWRVPLLLQKPNEPAKVLTWQKGSSFGGKRQQKRIEVAEEDEEEGEDQQDQVEEWKLHTRLDFWPLNCLSYRKFLCMLYRFNLASIPIVTCNQALRTKSRKHKRRKKNNLKVASRE
ncbi:hypothetical protein RUM43_011824 [Polyplax serrata]|uniref:Uncharacterized protein n=1 Tax=Polyplax serrata TaxID=468196 RepID=A0AAN8S9S0_POLSC